MDAAVHISDGPAGRGDGGGGRQLPGLARPRADDLDAARVRGHDVRALEASPSRGSARRSRSAPTRSARTSRRPSASARRPTSCSTEYRERLKEAREQADDIVARARKASETAVAEATAEGKAKREELVAAARQDIETETRRSLEQIRKEVADLTVLATEKVTRKSLDDDDQKRLVEEALSEVDFSALAGKTESNGGGRPDGGDRARIRRRAVRGRQGSRTSSTRSTSSSAQFADALDENHDLQRLLLQPLLLLGREARRRSASDLGADARADVNFLELLAEKHRMPAIFRIRRRFDELWAEENKRLEVTLTSAVELDRERRRAGRRGDRASQTDRKIDLTTEVDDDILGGLVLRVGNMVLDASLRSKLERLRKEVASAAYAPRRTTRSTDQVEIKPDEISKILASGSRGSRPDAADLSEVGTVLSVADGIARVHGLDNCMSLEMLELPHDVTGLALNLEADNVGAVLFGDWDKVVEGDTVKRTGHLLEIPVGDELLGRIVDPLGPPARRQGRDQHLRDAPGRVQGAGRRPAPAGGRAGADRAQGDRRDDPDRPRPARADHRRPPDRQDGDRDRHDHQQQGQGPDLHLRRDRPADVDRRPGRRRCSRRTARWRTRSSSPRPPTRRRRSSSWRRTPAARWASTSSTTASTRSASTTTSPSTPTPTARCRCCCAARRAARRTRATSSTCTRGCSSGRSSSTTTSAAAR